MEIDLHTLDDLEVFTGKAGRPSLLEWLDRTRTTGGRRALERRFRDPQSDPDKIRAIQRSIAACAARWGTFAPLPAEAQYRDCARYLNSNAVILPDAGTRGSGLKAAWLRLARPGVFREVRTGVRAACELLAKIAALVASVGDSDTSELGSYAHRIARLLGDARFDPLLAPRARRPRPLVWILEADRLLRKTLRRDLEEAIACAHEIEALIALARVYRVQQKA